MGKYPQITQISQIFVLGLLVLLVGCRNEVVSVEGVSTAVSTPQPTIAATVAPTSEPSPEPTPVPTVVPMPEADAPFFLGLDLSYVNEMDDCGAVYLEDGESRDAYELFADHGANLVRARLWHNPDWTDYSTLADVTRTFSRAKAAGMATLLSIHYSDNWADPGKQEIPAAWADLTEAELPDALYQYTYDVLSELYAQGVLPNFIQIGNETNAGLVKRADGLDWPRDAQLFNAGIRAVRTLAAETNSNPKIVLHVAQPENAGWWFREATQHGVTDFDVIGLSYYPQWSQLSPVDVGAFTTYLRQTYGKEVMIVETAYPWTFDAAEETADNILNQGIRGYGISPAGQRQFLVDLSQSVLSNGGLGVVYWEPAWVSTQCTTRWGQGSHWENATFFDFQNGNELHEGVEFLSYPYLYPAELVDGVVEASYGAPLLQDEPDDNFMQFPHLDLLDLHVRDDADLLYLAITVADDVYAAGWGQFMLYLDISEDGQGGGVDVDNRPITVAAPYQPEFRLDLRVMDWKGTAGSSFEFYAWDGTVWQNLALPVGTAVHPGTPSVIELALPRALLGDPAFVNVAVVSTGRGRAHTAGDVLGRRDAITDWADPVILDQFGHYVLQ
ncbi:MAG: glycosyl hydrolase 53 family protein [Anaerolineae bacterium]|nr:glycosyl hydrolase 53 family protein [Anaerolineae bacterium]